MNKRGQGLPLNTIIIAIIVLVVLVVLIAIFVGRIGKFDQDINKEGELELIKLKASYGTCKPSVGAETSFQTAYNAENTNKGQLTSEYAKLISLCKNRNAANCENAVDTSTTSILGGCSN